MELTVHYDPDYWQEHFFHCPESVQQEAALCYALVAIEGTCYQTKELRKLRADGGAHQVRGQWFLGPRDRPPPEAPARRRSLARPLTRTLLPLPLPQENPIARSDLPPPPPHPDQRPPSPPPISMCDSAGPTIRRRGATPPPGRAPGPAPLPLAHGPYGIHHRPLAPSLLGRHCPCGSSQFPLRPPSPKHGVATPMGLGLRFSRSFQPSPLGIARLSPSPRGDSARAPSG